MEVSLSVRRMSRVALSQDHRLLLPAGAFQGNRNDCARHGERMLSGKLREAQWAVVAPRARDSPGLWSLNTSGALLTSGLLPKPCIFSNADLSGLLPFVQSERLHLSASSLQALNDSCDDHFIS